MQTSPLTRVARVAANRLDAISAGLVRTDSQRGLPLIVEPAVDGVDFESWGQRNRPTIDQWLNQYGAILFRGFALHDVADFDRASKAITGELLEYTERSSPR